MVPLKTKFAFLLGNTLAVAVQPIKEDAIKKKPSTKKRRVVVTGLGVVNPLGFDADIFYNNLLDGISGISEIEAFDSEIKSFSEDGWVAPKLLKREDKFMLYLLTAGKKALADGGITEDVMRELNKAKCGVVIGSSVGGMKKHYEFHTEENPFCIRFATATMGSAMLAIDLGWMGPNYSISAACATSNFCILNAANHIARGESDMMPCGGSDAAIIPIGQGFTRRRVKILSGTQDRVWPMTIRYDPDERVFLLNSGWKGFAHSHEMKAKDTIHFYRIYTLLMRCWQVFSLQKKLVEGPAHGVIIKLTPQSNGIDCRRGRP
ncbi:3-oxoacyl-[acyl-carrier-protein] synthase [Actinidia chinensis var. chinensis]|uniref:beta-ketoacyl-[acyl-carrier-protein] synthase I n=1 Tax=Actinidia chinensis var. chinensis TaxID=1590841 RepID=A0A2R6QAU8_ACTCC|nr:3-oxoacyl-[acyl-carrier-protein] synthase [Actinidia chinensis var. chinensis]